MYFPVIHDVFMLNLCLNTINKIQYIVAVYSWGPVLIIVRGGQTIFD